MVLVNRMLCMYKRLRPISALVMYNNVPGTPHFTPEQLLEWCKQCDAQEVHTKLLKAEVELNNPDRKYMRQIVKYQLRRKNFLDHDDILRMILNLALPMPVFAQPPVYVEMLTVQLRMTLECKKERQNNNGRLLEEKSPFFE